MVSPRLEPRNAPRWVAGAARPDAEFLSVGRGQRAPHVFLTQLLACPASFLPPHRWATAHRRFDGRKRAKPWSRVRCLGGSASHAVVAKPDVGGHELVTVATPRSSAGGALGHSRLCVNAVCSPGRPEKQASLSGSRRLPGGSGTGRQEGCQKRARRHAGQKHDAAEHHTLAQRTPG